MTTISFFKYETNKYWAFTQMGNGYKIFDSIKGLLFYKFLGTGAGAGFSLLPDFSTYAILCVWENESFAKDFINKSEHSKLISSRASKRKDFFLKTIKSHGKWDGKNPFKSTGHIINSKNKVGIITRATVNKYRLFEFWNSVPKASLAIQKAEGVEWYKGIGEWPFIQQATFSVWKNINLVKKFAYEEGLHKEIVKKTKSRNWYSEDLFARFEIIGIEDKEFYM